MNLKAFAEVIDGIVAQKAIALENQFGEQGIEMPIELAGDPRMILYMDGEFQVIETVNPETEMMNLIREQQEIIDLLTQELMGV
jgi:uncharacterized protein involved in tellurium resistance